MEGFKSSQKMQCFKEGGSVKYKSRHSEKSEMSEDIAQDKKVVKKAVKIHDEQQHKGEKTNLSKLKDGGRMKKEGGCVGRYKAGKKVKKAAAPSKAAIKPAMSNITEPAPTMSPAMSPAMSLDKGVMPPPMMKKGGKAKKYNTGGGVTDAVKSVGKKLYENVMGTPEQNKAAAEQEKAIAEKDPSSYEAKYRKLTGKKEGGKACQ
tara:strand:+ start:249 stop:863 length:615 start_codon:yes stop_codon:yes gene_type:complete